MNLTQVSAVKRGNIKQCHLANSLLEGGPIIGFDWHSFYVNTAAGKAQLYAGEPGEPMA